MSYQTPLPSGRTPFLPAAPYYDGRSKDTILDAAGNHRGIHPVDAAMALALMVRRGSCKTNPTLGNDLHLITDPKSTDLADQVRAKVLAAEPLARVVSEGKARIDRIDSAGSRGTLAVVVYYTNLDTGERNSTEWYT
jgi:hypothetical protein